MCKSEIFVVLLFPFVNNTLSGLYMSSLLEDAKMSIKEMMPSVSLTLIWRSHHSVPRPDSQEKTIMTIGR